MKIAFTFPGQGSQSVGMMQAYGSLPHLRSTFAEASEVLGEDLWKMAQDGPAELLSETTRTQPLMLTAGIALYRAWKSLGGRQPAMVAGHSLGEYTALVAAGALDFDEAVRLVRFRAESMQDAVPAGTGGIAAILGLDDDSVRSVCREASHHGESVEAANYNSPSQVVIAGNRSAVERAMALAKENGAKRAVMLPMSVPSHCSLMRPAGEKLKIRLDATKLHMPSVPVLHNADVSSASNLDELKDALVRQLSSPVRWVETVQDMVRRQCDVILECGPGKVLQGLNKRIDSGPMHLSLGDKGSFESALAELKQS
jgi:[acyl-carrier-protein] S-malonyltransferase